MVDLFLESVHDKLQNGCDSTSDILIITGNEACDLDSAMCALAYSYFKQQLDHSITVIPLCQINRDEMPLRTEIVHWLTQCNLPWESLVYADDLFESELGRGLHENNLGTVQLILVDHHVPTDRFVNHHLLEVIDHHHVLNDTDPGVLAKLKACKINRVESVGSCASLVTCEVLAQSPCDLQLPPVVWKLLYGAILMDTVGLSKLGYQAGRLMELDLRMANRIEDMISGHLFSDISSRELLFANLEKSKFNVQGLSTWDLLRRDMKIAAGPTTDPSHRFVCSTISGMDLDPLCHCSDLICEVGRFCSFHSAVLWIGITVGFAPTLQTEENEVPRRKGLIIINSGLPHSICTELVEYLCQPVTDLNLRSESLDVTLNEKLVFTGIIENPKATRKAVLPALIRFLHGDRAGSAKPDPTSFDGGKDGNDDSPSEPPHTRFHLDTDRPALQNSVDRLRKWMSKLAPEERLKIVRSCLDTVARDESHEAYQPIGILPADVLEQVTLLLVKQIPSEISRETRQTHSLKTNAMDVRPTDFHPGRRQTMPVRFQSLIPTNHLLQPDPKYLRRQSELYSSPIAANQTPKWLETEYLRRLPSWLPGQCSHNPTDAVEDVSFRLYNRLSHLSVEASEHSVAFDDTPSTAELQLLRASFGDLEFPLRQQQFGYPLCHSESKMVCQSTAQPNQLRKPESFPHSLLDSERLPSENPSLKDLET